MSKYKRKFKITTTITSTWKDDNPQMAKADILKALRDAGFTISEFQIEQIEEELNAQVIKKTNHR